MSNPSETQIKPNQMSAWAPFGYSAFALLWTATLVSNIGTWMHDVGAGWLMATMAPSPAIVALVQAATTLPVFLFALFAGALADRVDKRKFLILINALLTIVIFLLAGMTYFALTTPLALLAFTFLIGTGAAFMAPAWQAIVPSLVPSDTLKPAIALNSMGINIARAIGPALAGFLITAIGLWAPFLLNALSHVFIIVALVIWRAPKVKPQRLPPEPLFGSMVTGLRHAANNAPLKSTLIRSFGFFIFASAFWALLPLVARGLPGEGAEVYGFLLAAIGVGAVSGALLLPRLSARVDTNVQTAVGTIVTATAMGLLALAPSAPLAILAALLGGLGWITVLTNLNISAQSALPNWVRARGLAVALMVFFGSMAAGATLWGQVASFTSIEAALLVAAAGVVLAVPATWKARLGQGEMQDLSPSLAWPAPDVSANVLGDEDDRGPVLITIRYEIDQAKNEEFVVAASGLASERYRDGAYDWGLYQDVSEPGVWVSGSLFRVGQSICVNTNAPQTMIVPCS